MARSTFYTDPVQPAPQQQITASGQTSRNAILLGHPQPLSTATVYKRRQRLEGLPITKDRASAFGAAAGVIGDEFSLNVCDLIVSELAASLNVVALTVPKGEQGSDEAKAAKEFVWECWERSELAASTEGLFTAAAGDGQAFLVLDYDADGQPTAYVNTAYDGTTGIEVKNVDGDGVLTVAVKHEVENLVRDNKTGLLRRMVDWFLMGLGVPVDREATSFVERLRRTVYLYDRDTNTTQVRYFITDPGTPEYEVSGDLDENGEEIKIELGSGNTVWPAGMPVLAFVAPGGGELEEMESPQRLVNVAALDLVATAQTDSLRIGWTIDCAAVGGGTGKTAKGSSDPIYMRPGAWLNLISADDTRQGTVGSLAPADLNAQRENVKLMVELAMLLGRTPTHILPWNQTGAVPSGAALRIANAPFAAKVERYQELWTVVFKRLFELWQRMAGRAVMECTPVWRPLRYTSRTEDLADAVVAQTLGLPTPYIASEVLSMTPDEAEDWEAESERVAGDRAAMVAALGISRSQIGENGGMPTAPAIEPASPPRSVQSPPPATP